MKPLFDTYIDDKPQPAKPVAAPAPVTPVTFGTILGAILTANLITGIVVALVMAMNHH